MNKRTNTTKLTITALLTAIAIVIPMIMPIKILIGPASFTLASHVPIFLAMFFTPGMAVFVSLGATAGFLLSGFPIVITLRALSHVIFAYVGGKYIQNRRHNVLNSPVKSQMYSFVLAVIHAVSETIIVSLFFFGAIPGAEYQTSFFYSVFLLVGVGTIIHSMVDFLVSQFIWKSLEKRMNKIIDKIEG